MKHITIALALVACFAFVTSPAFAVDVPIGQKQQTAPAIPAVAPTPGTPAIPAIPAIDPVPAKFASAGNPTSTPAQDNTGKCVWPNGWKKIGVDSNCNPIALTGNNGGHIQTAAAVPGVPGVPGVAAVPGTPGSPAVPAQCSQQHIGVGEPAGHNGVHTHSGNC